MTEQKCDKSVDLGLNLKYLTCLGIWPPENGTKFWKCILLYIFFFTGLLLQAFMLFCEVTVIVINTEELDEVTDSIFSAVITFQGLFKQVYISYHIKQFQHLVACMNTVFYKAHQPFRSDKESILKTSRLYTNTITVTVSSLCLAASFLYPFIPLTENFGSIKSGRNISDTRPLPYPVWFPLDKNQTPCHEILYTLISLNAIVVALYISSTDTFIVSIIIHTFSQFDILQFMLRNVTRYSASHVTEAHKKINKTVSLAIRSDRRNQTYMDIAEEQRKETGSNKGTKLNLQGETLVREYVEENLQHNLRDCILQHQELLTYVFMS
jgi:7tm Odorant receptor.